jgi:hypothetical protein
MKKDFTDKQLEIMELTVKNLVGLHHDCLNVFLEDVKDQEDRDDIQYPFTKNVAANYLGNIIYLGVTSDDPKDYEAYAANFINHLKDYFAVSIKSMIEQKLKMKKEVH